MLSRKNYTEGSAGWPITSETHLDLTKYCTKLTLLSLDLRETFNLTQVRNASLTEFLLPLVGVVPVEPEDARRLGHIQADGVPVICCSN